MTAVFVVDACQTPIGKIKGALAGVRPDHLSAVDDIYSGAANQADEAFTRAVEVVGTRLDWRLVSPWMKEKFPPIGWGETAENVAEKYGVSRERQDEFALRSHRLAAQRRRRGAVAGVRGGSRPVGTHPTRAFRRHRRGGRAPGLHGHRAGSGDGRCSGARIITTLLHEMRRREARKGAATMCIGVGQGIASLWENI